MNNTFFHTWVKYMPIIRILLKRSLTEEQVLKMNNIDFIRAAGGRKVKFDFSISLLNGKFENLELPTQMGRSLVDALRDDKVSSQFVKTNHLQFSMNKNFELVIKNSTRPPEPEALEQPEITT
jgi:hypothetical protein